MAGRMASCGVTRPPTAVKKLSKPGSGYGPSSPGSAAASAAAVSVARPLVAWRTWADAPPSHPRTSAAAERACSAPRAVSP